MVSQKPALKYLKTTDWIEILLATAYLQNSIENYKNTSMNKKRIGIGLLIAGLFVLGVGIGLKLSNSEIGANTIIIVGLVLNSIGLSILISANKKSDN